MASTTRSVRPANIYLQRLVAAALMLHGTADLTALAWAITTGDVFAWLLFVMARFPLMLFGYCALRTLERRATRYSSADRPSNR